MSALGLIDANFHPTSRLTRMLEWLTLTPPHPALAGIEVDSLSSSVTSFSKLVLAALPTSPHVDLAFLVSFATNLTVSLKDRAVNELAPVGRFVPSDSLRDADLTRFNLTGEYLLRRDETIDRTFFATPISEIRSPEHDTITTTAFALGTILDAHDADDHLAFRLKTLRQVVSAVAEFGLSRRWTEEAEYRSASRNFTHVFATPLHAAVDEYQRFLITHTEANSQEFQQATTRMGATLSVLRHTLDASTRLIGVSRARQPANLDARCDLPSVLKGLLHSGVARKFQRSVHVRLSTAGRPEPIRGNAGDWQAIGYVLLKNACEAAHEAQSSHDSTDTPVVTIVIKYRDGWVPSDKVAYCTLLVRNPSCAVPPPRLKELERALRGQITRLAPNQQKDSSAGVGLVIAGEKLRARPICAVPSVACENDFIIRIERIPIYA